MKTILITGASTGIGLITAQHLAQRGYQVYAGVRKTADLDRLNGLGIPTLKPIILDVTQAEQIQAAAQQIQTEAGELFGLVNNAGIAFPSPLEFTPYAEAEQHFAVNVLGAMAITQACLPMLRHSGGRIIQMSSMGGRNSAPYFGVYCASKFALEGMSDALRVELRPWNIKVIILEPGAIDTPIWTKSTGEQGEMFAGYPPQAQELYGKAMRILSKTVPKTKGLPAEQVAELVEKALTVKNPKARYVMDTTSRVRALIEHLPTAWRDSIMARYFGIE